jgi:serine protease Do
MSNEFNNENENNYNYQYDNNTEGTSNQGKPSNPVDTYSSGNYYSYNNSNPYPGYSNGNNLYNTYPTPQVTEVKKLKKKRRGFGAFKVTAAAIAFGLIAGVVFQAYSYVANLGSVGENTKSNQLQVTQVMDDNKDGTIVPANTGSDSVVTDVSGIVDNVMPAIVVINSSATVTNYDFFGRQYNEPVQGSGSGIIIGQNDSQLLIATNNHVVSGATNVEIKFVDETTAKAEVKGTDANADLAVVSVDMNQLSEDTASKIKIATLGNSDKLKPGEMAIAIGNALGYGQSVTVGYISAVNREVQIEDKTMTLLQTDAAINPGNSGGALINTSGQVVGINSVKFASQEVEGMGYAIPISHAIPIINELMNRETVAVSEQGYLGINAQTAQNVTDIYAKRFNMPIGVYVNDVIPNSPAEKAGLTGGSIIAGVNDVTVKTIDELASILSYKKSGENINLKIFVPENGEYVEKTLSVTLGSKKQ